MKKIIICTLSLLTIGFGIHVEKINLVSSDLVTINEAEARGGGGGRRHHGGRRGHTSVHVSTSHHHGPRIGGAIVAGAVIATTAAVIGSRHTRLPNSCTNYDYSGRPYYNCGGVYYQPVYTGPDVVYVVVDKP